MYVISSLGRMEGYIREGTRHKFNFFFSRYIGDEEGVEMRERVEALLETLSRKNLSKEGTDALVGRS
jgi:hypothetical protein